MNKFFEDYKELCALNRRFYKNHGIGIAIVNIGFTAMCIGGATIVKHVKESMNKKKQEKDIIIENPEL